MKEDVLDELLNVITANRYVNLHFRECNRENRKVVESIVSRIREEVEDDFFLDIDVRVFSECTSEEQEAGVILEMVKKELSQKQINVSIPKTISIADALEKLNEQLDRPGIAVFHCFQDNHSEKEKDILRSVRTFQTIARSLYLGFLIISGRKIDNWELFPESNLDKRHVTFFEYRQ